MTLDEEVREIFRIFDIKKPQTCRNATTTNNYDPKNTLMARLKKENTTSD